MKLPLERDSWKQYAFHFKMADWPDRPLMMLPIVWLFHVILWHPLNSWSTRVSRAWVNKNRSIQEVWLQIDCRITWRPWWFSLRAITCLTSNYPSLQLSLSISWRSLFICLVPTCKACAIERVIGMKIWNDSLNPDRDFSMLVELTVEMYKHTTRDEYWQLFLKQPLFFHVHLLKAISRV